MKRTKWLLVLTVIIIIVVLTNMQGQTNSPPTSTTNLPTRAAPTLNPARQVISAKTSEQVTQLSRWGEGTFGPLAQSDDGRWLAVATSLGIRLYDAQTLTPTHFIETSQWVTSVAFSPDSTLLASTQGDSIRLWSIADGSLRRTLEGQTDLVLHAIFAADGTALVSAARDGSVYEWRVADGALQQTIDTQTYAPSIEFSPDGMFLAVGGISKKPDNRGNAVIQLRQADNEQLVREIKTDLPSVNRVAFSPDGKHLAVAANFVAFGDVAIWQIDGTLVYKLTRPRPDAMLAVTDVGFSLDGQTLLSAWADGLIRQYRASDGTSLQNFGKATSSANGLLISPDGQFLTATYGEGTLRRWSLNSGQLVKGVTLHGEAADDLRFSPTEDEIALVTGNLIEVRRISDNVVLHTLKGHTQSIYSLGYSPDGKRLATASRDQTIKIWDIATEAALQTLPGQGRCLSFSSDGIWLAGIGEQGQAWLWNSQIDSDVTPLGQAPTRDEAATCAAFLPDGTLAVGFSTGIIQIWQPHNGTLLRTMGGNHPYLYYLAASHDGKYLAIQSSNQQSAESIQILQLSDGMVHQIVGGKCASCLVSFSPDSQLLIGSQDNDILIWQVTDGKLLTTLTGHTSQVLSVAFSSDSKLLVSTSNDRTIRLWGVR